MEGRPGFQSILGMSPYMLPYQHCGETIQVYESDIAAGEAILAPDSHNSVRYTWNWIACGYR